MTRSVKFWLMTVAALILIFIAVFLIPYRIEHSYINRRTGEIAYNTTHWMVSQTPKVTIINPNLERFGELTASESWLLISDSVFMFPWSKTSTNWHWCTKSDLNNWWLKALVHVSFIGPEDHQTRNQVLPENEFEKLMKSRLEIWNTMEIDSSLEVVLTKVAQENQRLSLAASPIKNTKVILEETTTTEE